MRVVGAGLALLLGLAGAQSAQAMAFGPFVLNDDRPETVELAAPLSPGDGRLFWEWIIEMPGIETLVLSGTGGAMADALVVAELVHGLGFGTRIDSGTVCSGACALIFMAGTVREAEGEIVFLPAAADASASAADREAAALVPERLAAYGASPELLALIAGLPPKGKILTAGEIADFGIEEAQVAMAPQRGPAPAATRAPAPAAAPDLNFAAPAPPAALPEIAFGALAAPADAPIDWMGDARPVGPAVTGAVEIREAGGRVVRSDEASVQWSVGGTNAPFVRVTAATADPAVTITIDYFHATPSQSSYVGAMAMVTLASDAALPPEAVVTNFRALSGRVATPLNFASAMESVGQGAITMRLDLLAAFTPFTDRTLETAEELVIAFTLADGRDFRVRLPLGTGGAAAFVEARQLRGG